MTLLAERPAATVLSKKTALTDLTSYEDFSGRMRFTRELCDVLEHEGHLNERYELLDGEIILKVGLNWPHIIVTTQAQYWLAAVYGNVHVVSQSDIEVSDTTLKDNLVRKSALYARAGVPEYWVIDINARRLHKHQEPVGGVYKTVAVLGEDEMIARLSAPESAVRVSELLAQPEVAC